MSIETPGAHDCGADEAPHLAGLLRVTMIFDDGEGDTVYFDPERLPDLMREIGRIKDVREPKSSLPDADPGALIVHRWREPDG